jgi:hypothetical protein
MTRQASSPTSVVVIHRIDDDHTRLVAHVGPRADAYGGG